MEKQLSEILTIYLQEIDRAIKVFIGENEFYINFKNKCWASSPEGQYLMKLTILSNNIRYKIEFLKKNGW
jgi:hypothetical protein